MPVDPASLSEFNKQQVILVAKGEDDQAHEYEGLVTGGSAAGLAFKPKGKREVVLVEPGDIEDIRLAPAKAKKMVQKKVKEIAEGNMRQHLVDRHGLTLQQGNDLTEEDAVKLHDKYGDHKGLGHRHVKADEKEEASEEKSAA
jgi:hypothetical protein